MDGWMRKNRGEWGQPQFSEDLPRAGFKLGKGLHALQRTENFIVGEAGRFIRQKCWLCPDPEETSGGKLRLGYRVGGQGGGTPWQSRRD